MPQYWMNSASSSANMFLVSPLWCQCSSTWARELLLALFISAAAYTRCCSLTRLNPRVSSEIRSGCQALRFSTATSNATIPMNIDTLEEKERQPTVFVLHRPLGATVTWMVRPSCRVLLVVFVAGVRHPAAPADYRPLLQPQRSPPSVPQACLGLVWLHGVNPSIRSVCRLPASADHES